MLDFNPHEDLYNNITRFADPFGSRPVSIYPCVITKVNKNLTAEILLPHISSVMINIPIVFNSFSENRGDINIPEENSLSLYIESSDGKKFVYGGVPLS